MRRSRSSTAFSTLCAVGPSTASRVQRYGIRVDLMPAEYRTEAIIQALGDLGTVEGQGLSVRQTEELVRRLREPRPPRAPAASSGSRAGCKTRPV